MVGDATFQSFLSESHASYNGDVQEPDMLQNEVIALNCMDCTCHFQLGQSFLAVVYCTNYRICVVPEAFHAIDQRRGSNGGVGGGSCQDGLPRLRLYDDRTTLPLWLISHVQYATFKNGLREKMISPFRNISASASSGRSRSSSLRSGKSAAVGGSGSSNADGGLRHVKFKEVTGTISSMETVSVLRIYFKDMRVLVVDMRRSQNACQLVNHIVHFSRPSKPDKLISGEREREERERRVPYCDRKSWETELRCAIVDESHRNYWRILDLADECIHAASHSYPPNVVICSALSKQDIRDASTAYVGGRYPVWIWAWRGVSLLRSSEPLELSVLHSVIQRKIEDKLAGMHETNDVPATVRVDELSIERICSSWSRLQKLCAVSDVSHSKKYGKEWIKRLESTEWMTLVHTCLKYTARVIGLMADEGRNVVLQDELGFDASAIVSSLVQMCMDPTARRLDGLERIINKEWLSMGHPFGVRLLGMSRGGRAPFCPVFLLFLDALQQLVRAYPMQFEYSQWYLLGLWDLALSGTAPALCCDDATERMLTRRTTPVFPLDAHFLAPFTLLFHNIDFLASSQICRTGMIEPLQCDILRPPTAMYELEFWTECYLRWHVESNVEHGGEVVTQWAIDRKMRDGVSAAYGVQWTPTVSIIPLEQLNGSFPFSTKTRLPESSNGLSEAPSITSLLSSFSALKSAHDHSPPPPPPVSRRPAPLPPLPPPPPPPLDRPRAPSTPTSSSEFQRTYV